MAAEEDWTVFRRFDEFNLVNLLMLQDEIQKLGKDFKDSCREHGDDAAAANSAWYAPPNALTSSNASATEVEAQKRRVERRQRLWTRLKEKLKEYSEFEISMASLEGLQP